MNQMKQTIRTFVRFNNRTFECGNIHSSQHYFFCSVRIESDASRNMQEYKYSGNDYNC